MKSLVKTETINRVLHVHLCRPEAKNALQPAMIEDLFTIFKKVSKDKTIRAVLLRSQGDIFCAGADLHWMKESISDSKKKNLKTALALYDMYASIYHCSKPVIARIHGSAFGGGVGLIACCDIGIMVESATLSLSELKLGLIPATIAPFFQRKIGWNHLRYYGLRSKKISAVESLSIGLVQELAVNEQDLDKKVEALLEEIRVLSPEAIRRFKKLCNEIEFTSVKKARTVTSVEIASIRTSPEAQEGIRAFFEKRPPKWT